MKGTDQTEGTVSFPELDHLFQIQTVRKQLNSFYCHQLCYGNLNKWKSKVIVQSHYIQHYTKSGFFCLLNIAFVVEELPLLRFLLLWWVCCPLRAYVDLSDRALQHFRECAVAEFAPNSWLFVLQLYVQINIHTGYIYMEFI